MPKFFVKGDQINGNEITIVGEDVNHIVNVLRLKEKDEINICNTDTRENYIAKMVGANGIRPKKAEENNRGVYHTPLQIKCRIIKKLEPKHESNIHITIFQGLPKADKMELVIEKCIELGADEVTPVEMKRCIVKLDDKTKTKKIDRWQKIAETAAKQSGRDIIPKVNEIINVKNICNLIDNYDIVLLAYEEEKKNTLKAELQNFVGAAFEGIPVRHDTTLPILRIGIIIGPEGGLEPDEVAMLKQNGAKVITLGSRILRTETVRNYDDRDYNVRTGRFRKVNE